LSNVSLARWSRALVVETYATGLVLIPFGEMGLRFKPSAPHHRLSCRTSEVPPPKHQSCSSVFVCFCRETLENHVEWFFHTEQL
jgi:hypothetical protein